MLGAGQVRRPLSQVEVRRHNRHEGRKRSKTQKNYHAVNFWARHFKQKPQGSPSCRLIFDNIRFTIRLPVNRAYKFNTEKWHFYVFKHRSVPVCSQSSHRHMSGTPSTRATRRKKKLCSNLKTEGTTIEKATETTSEYWRFYIVDIPVNRESLVEQIFRFP